MNPFRLLKSVIQNSFFVLNTRRILLNPQDFTSEKVWLQMIQYPSIGFDYMIFSLSLAMGVVIGLVYYIKDRHQKTKEEYLLGGKNLNVIVVGVSMIVSAIDAVFFLGGTAEIRYR